LGNGGVGSGGVGSSGVGSGAVGSGADAAGAGSDAGAGAGCASTCSGVPPAGRHPSIFVHSDVDHSIKRVPTLRWPTGPPATNCQ
jgi:hypothetical protein